MELGVRYQESSVGPHELDAVNALRNLQSLTPDRDTEALTLLQAAAWHPEFRQELAGKTVKVASTLDALTPVAGTPTLVQALDAIAVDRVDGMRQLLSYLDAGGTVEEIVATYSALIVDRASGDEHHYKYNLALFEEIAAALPEWRRTLILGITLRGPTSRSTKWARYDDARAIIAAL